MYVLGFDLETTGLDTQESRITQIGAVVWDVEKKIPVCMRSVIVNPGVPIPKEITELNGTTDELVQQFGISPGDALEELNYLCIKSNPSYIIAHNGENYDRPLLSAEAKRHHKDLPNMVSVPWIDTRTDLPFDREPNSRKLDHLALDAGFLNPFPHQALTDVLTMLRVFSSFPIEKVIEYQKIPFVTMRALVSYDDRQKAKDLRFGWEVAGDRKYEKCWVKMVKENLIPQELAAAAKIGVQLVRL